MSLQAYGGFCCNQKSIDRLQLIHPWEILQAYAGTCCNERPIFEAIDDTGVTFQTQVLFEEEFWNGGCVSTAVVDPANDVGCINAGYRV